MRLELNNIMLTSERLPRLGTADEAGNGAAEIPNLLMPIGNA
jgi:hypothetical protein